MSALKPARRSLLRAAALALPPTALAPRLALADGTHETWPAVRPGRPLRFPRDHGAHPEYRTEWWYLTGWLRVGNDEPLGVQITFFRSRTRHTTDNPSRFAPRQLLFAHVAIASAQRGRLTHAERSARSGFGLAQFAIDDLDVSIGDWRLWRSPDDRVHARIEHGDFGLDLLFVPPGPPVPQGDAGFSRKGPLPTQASWYYSRPQLAVSGSVRGTGEQRSRAVSGSAWLDHEWSSEILDAQAAGWDWVGLNLDDGGALMAFRIRRHDGTVLWSHARWLTAGEIAVSAATDGREPRRRGADGGGGEPAIRAGAPEFAPIRLWRSPRSGARWPVEMQLRIGQRELRLEPLIDDQEIDAAASTGTIYWEGAVRVVENGRRIGAGYLELTGYAGELAL